MIEDTWDGDRWRSVKLSLEFYESASSGNHVLRLYHDFKADPRPYLTINLAHLVSIEDLGPA